MTKVVQAASATVIPLQVGHIFEFLARGVITRVKASGKLEGFELQLYICDVIRGLVIGCDIVPTFSSLNTFEELVKRLRGEEFIVVIGSFSTSIQKIKLNLKISGTHGNK